MTDQGRQENRYRHDLGRKHRLGDQVGLVEQGGGRALDGLAKQQPGQHPGEDVQRVFLLARRRRHAQADLENEHPTEQQYQRVNEAPDRSEEHTSELQSRQYLVCRLLLEKKKNKRAAYETPPTGASRYTPSTQLVWH